MLLDFHSHILPGIDDGSRDVDESCGLLKMLSAQGIGTVIATPHFEANNESVASFIKRRQVSYDNLKAAMMPTMPDVKLGAEVAYYPGISRLEGLRDLCIEGTELLLLEMPMSKWSNYIVEELVNLSCTRKVRVIVAHIERYINFQDKQTLRTLFESDVLLQINASFLLNLSTRRKGIVWLKKGVVQLVGSDCHNLRSRKPRMDEAYEVIASRLGDGFVREMTHFGEKLMMV